MYENSNIHVSKKNRPLLIRSLAKIIANNFSSKIEFVNYKYPYRMRSIRFFILNFSINFIRYIFYVRWNPRETLTVFAMSTTTWCYVVVIVTIRFRESLAGKKKINSNFVKLCAFLKLQKYTVVVYRLRR